MYAAKLTKNESPLSMSEAELAALEEQGRELVEAGKTVRHHLTNCHHGDQRTLNALDALLKYIGIHDKVVPSYVPTQPKDY